MKVKNKKKKKRSLKTNPDIPMAGDKERLHSGPKSLVIPKSDTLGFHW